MQGPLPVPVPASTPMTRRRSQDRPTTMAAGIKTRSLGTSGTSDNKPSGRLRSSARTPLSPAPPLAPGAQPELAPGRIDKSVLTIAEPKRLRDKAHLGFVASQPCLVCGRQPSDPHHLRFAQPRAIGLKVSDEFTVPLCRGHHRQLHQAGNEVTWWGNFNLKPLEVAKALWGQTHPKSADAADATDANLQPSNEDAATPPTET